MANSITEARTQQYKANVTMLYQQKMSKLRKIGRVEYVVGKQAFFERLAPSEALEKTVRHSEQSIVDSIHSRRMVILRDYYWNDYIDKEDKLKMLIDPQSPYAQNAASALVRKLDSLVYFGARGSALSGETGSTSVVLPSAQKIAHGSAGMSLAKILQGSRLLNAAEVPMDGRYAVIESNGLEDLLNIQQLTSSDYNAVKLLTTGEMNQFMGFEWTIYNFAAETSVYYGIFCHRDALGIALAQDVMTRIDELPHKHYLTQVYASTSGGATRVLDEGVVEVAYQ
jgi:hypothetical protein